MAKHNRTTSKARRANAAKPTSKRAPVEWGYENGRQIVTRVTGRWARDLPVTRWRALRDTIEDMGGVVEAIDSLTTVAGNTEINHPLLCMCATVARALMLDAEGHMQAALALSPSLREAIAREDARMAKPIGVAS